ncbi:MAG: magnesium transporter [Deltaproteobacteria bacterium]|nr:magnesium transporter [Deltaproteobacteria bacterium]
MPISNLQIRMLRKLLQSGTEEKIAHAIEKIHPSDISLLFSELSPGELQRLINSLCLIAKAGATLRELPEFLLPDILEQIEDKKMAGILSRLDPSEALFFFEHLPEARSRHLLDFLPEWQKEKLIKLLLYPKNSAGSMMTSNYLIVRAEMTVEEALASLRSQPEVKGVFYIYVVDEAKQLNGVLSLRNLVLAAPHTKIREIMDPEVQAVLAVDDQEKAAQMVAQYNLLAVPVVNESHELLGAITVDDVIDIVKEEATEDIYNLAGLSEADRAATPIGVKVKKRLPWMVLNLFTAAMAASVVGFFQHSIEKFVALAVFMPIVAGMGGNGGTQSLTVITRAIALGELNFVKAYKAVLKEAANGLILGATCGVLIGLVGFLWKGNYILGAVLFLAMMLNLLMGGLVGALVPLSFRALKLDPAIGTSVLVTMCTDIFGFLSFLGLATLLLEYLV